ncbi:hypothetical protein Tco_0460880 [Tanacetum coccineum]
MELSCYQIPASFDQKHARFFVIFQASTDISKITRKQSKTGKHGHENQKSTKRSQRIKAEARKVKPQDSSVKSRAIIGLLKHRAHAAMKETQRGMGFALNTLTQLAQAVTSKNDSLAIRVSVQNDQTAQNHLAMIRRIKGAD